jgi:hypothetical protein
VAGRPVHEQVGGREPWRPGDRFSERTRPRSVAPDDDPVFLGNLARSQREDAELLRRWEDDLRRREEELRRGKDPDHPDK